MCNKRYLIDIINLPHATKCGAYNVLTHPSVSQSVRPLVSQSVRKSWGFCVCVCISFSETAQHNFVNLCRYEVHDNCMKFWIILFFWASYVPFKLGKFVKMKYTTETVSLKPLHRISWTFVVMKYMICRCAFSQICLIQFFFLGVMHLLN